ncbi:SURF1 family protein [Roseateles puraquae]|uniref:SURF1-like protein n=1 Tax=Roseateles puraquae TaxID=431059 RepID=A0A254NM23_9BURK|nr:SURF1 family protein [Roseateles puraquae]MDG0855689.1 SURF1 family protein [Roseateles puraquae]OWR05888.1 transmembrane cytochrome oxidase [Roseateles puraquae]
MTLRRWLALVAALLGVALTARLGVWQLDRAQQKLALQAAMEAEAVRPPLSAADVGAATPLHRRVVLRGQWLPERTVWLDNRPMDGRAGFYVVTPLRLAGRGDSVLVQRGWAPRDPANRTHLPPLVTPPGEVEITGRLAASPSRLYELGAGEAGLIRQNLDPATFALETGLALLPLTVIQTDGTDDGGLLRHWPAPDLGLQKHYGYAFQWFALCALILALYVWFQHVRPRLHRQQP